MFLFILRLLNLSQHACQEFCATVISQSFQIFLMKNLFNGLLKRQIGLPQLKRGSTHQVNFPLPLPPSSMKLRTVPNWAFKADGFAAA